jgi:hypothetical protein
MCVILLALIGAYHVVLWLVPMAFRKSTVAESPYVREVRSPKDEYRAILQTWEGVAACRHTAVKPFSWYRQGLI